MKTDETERMTRRALHLSRIIAPTLYGEPSFVQGAVLADLMSLWIAGHHVPGDPAATDEARKLFVEDWLKAVWKLVPESEKQITEQEAKNG